MMSPMARMFLIGTICGAGLLNNTWMLLDFHEFSLWFTFSSMIALFLLYLDYRRYYKGLS